MHELCQEGATIGAYGGGVAEGGGGSELAGPPEAVEGAGMLLATEPGSSKASTGAHALGPLTLPTKAHELSSFGLLLSSDRQQTRLDSRAGAVAVS